MSRERARSARRRARRGAGGGLDAPPARSTTRRARRRAERHVVAWFLLSVLFAAAFVAAFVAWPSDYVAPGEPGHVIFLLHTPVLGLTFGLAVAALGIGLTVHLKHFVPDEVAVQRWETGPSDDVDRAHRGRPAAAGGRRDRPGRPGFARRALLARDRRARRDRRCAGASAPSSATPGEAATGGAVGDAAGAPCGARPSTCASRSRRAAEIGRVRPGDMAPGAMMTVFPFRESERGRRGAAADGRGGHRRARDADPVPTRRPTCPAAARELRLRRLRRVLQDLHPSGLPGRALQRRDGNQPLPVPPVRVRHDRSARRWCSARPCDRCRSCRSR